VIFLVLKLFPIALLENGKSHVMYIRCLYLAKSSKDWGPCFSLLCYPSAITHTPWYISVLGSQLHLSIDKCHLCEVQYLHTILWHLPGVVLICTWNPSSLSFQFMGQNCILLIIYLSHLVASIIIFSFFLWTFFGGHIMCVYLS